MNRKFTIALVALCLLALPALLMAGFVPQNQVGPSGSGGSGSCTYCQSDNCGCDPPSSGCVLNYSCGCSSTDCNHACVYNCR